MGRKLINSNGSLVVWLLGIGLAASLLLTPEVNAGNVTYVYDQLHRLIRATYDDGTIIAYTYDRVGNRLVKNVVSNPTQVSLLVPNGGDFVPSGYMYTIQWVAPSQAVKFKLQLSRDTGTTWELIKDNIPDPWYHWQVPINANNRKQCLMKLIGYNAAGVTVGTDTSNSVFTIEVVGVRAPGSGETLTSGSVYRIGWATNKTQSAVATTKLEYTKDGGTTWNLITTLPENQDDPANPGIYSWTVPTVVNGKTQCKVKVTLKSSGGTIVGNDSSNNYFTIQP